MADIVFVDEKDNVIGAGSREEALEKGIVHRIVRIFLFDPKGRLLIQKRAMHISLPGKWDGSTSGHVDENEDYSTAAHRELQEEVGVSHITLKEVIKYYSEETDDVLIKKRFNVVYTADYNGPIHHNDEISEVQWISPDELTSRMQREPSAFTMGFIRSFSIL